MTNQTQQQNSGALPLMDVGALVDCLPDENELEWCISNGFERVQYYAFNHDATVRIVNTSVHALRDDIRCGTLRGDEFDFEYH